MNIKSKVKINQILLLCMLFPLIIYLGCNMPTRKTTINQENLTQVYIDSCNLKMPGKITVNINSKLGQIRFNQSNVWLKVTTLDSFLKQVGKPDRYRIKLTRSPTYIYDKLRFYISAREQKVTMLSVYFKKGQLDVAPYKAFNDSLIIDNVAISKLSKDIDIIKNLKLSRLPITKKYYSLENEKVRLFFNFDSPNVELVNILMENNW